MKPFKGDDKEEAETGNDVKDVRSAALQLLARREHSSEELKRKLIGKGHAATTVANVVGSLQEKRLVSDERFVSSFVHHHAARGQGPTRIRAELRQHGVAEALIQERLADPEHDWSSRAGQVRLRKFGARKPRNLAERAKQARFLQYRGFTTDQIRAALAASDSEEELDVLEGDLDLDSQS